MSYTLIKGEFHIHYPANPLNGPEPDGDTLKFRPDNRELVLALPKPNQPASFNRDGITSIRFEGIDALEIQSRPISKSDFKASRATQSWCIQCSACSTCAASVPTCGKCS